MNFLLNESYVHRYKFITANKMNFLGVGNKIKHPPKDKAPNVQFVDIPIEVKNFNKSLFNYVPC